MDFFKVVVWLNDRTKLKATAFRLSQVGLVDGIDFEEINIDQAIDFKSHQISLPDLQELTQLNFEDLFEFDTFEPNLDLEIANVDVLHNLIKKAGKKK